MDEKIWQNEVLRKLREIIKLLEDKGEPRIITIDGDYITEEFIDRLAEQMTQAIEKRQIRVIASGLDETHNPPK